MRKGRSKAFLLELRRKHKLGEFKTGKSTPRKKSKRVSSQKRAPETSIMYPPGILTPYPSYVASPPLIPPYTPGYSGSSSSS